MSEKALQNGKWLKLNSERMWKMKDRKIKQNTHAEISVSKWNEEQKAKEKCVIEEEKGCCELKGKWMTRWNE